MAISAKADAAQKTEAQKFLDWLAEPDNAAEFTKIEGQVPIAGVEGEQLAPQYEPVKQSAGQRRLRAAAEPRMAEPGRLRRPRPRASRA